MSDVTDEELKNPKVAWDLINAAKIDGPLSFYAAVRRVYWAACLQGTHSEENLRESLRAARKERDQMRHNYEIQKKAADKWRGRAKYAMEHAAQVLDKGIVMLEEIQDGWKETDSKGKGKRQESVVTDTHKDRRAD